MLVNIVCDLSCLKKNATLVSGWVGWWGGAGTFSPGRCHHQAGPVFSVAEVPPTDTTTSSPDPLSKGRGGGEGGFFNSPPPPTNTTTTPTPHQCSLQQALGKPLVVCLLPTLCEPLGKACSFNRGCQHPDLLEQKAGSTGLSSPGTPLGKALLGSLGCL